MKEWMKEWMNKQTNEWPEKRKRAEGTFGCTDKNTWKNE